MPKHKRDKQYCADRESDPYESWYRDTDIFQGHHREGAPCRIPRIDEHLPESADMLETIDKIDLPAHKLTGSVRQQYLKFLESLLERNYAAWSSTTEPYEEVTFTKNEIERCAESIEMKALQSCMIVSLYRNYVLKMISEIRKETKEFTLHSNLINMKFTPKVIKTECCNVGVQTDDLGNYACSRESSNRGVALPDVPTMSLDEKIRNFEKTINLPQKLPERTGKKHSSKARLLDNSNSVVSKKRKSSLHRHSTEQVHSSHGSTSGLEGAGFWKSPKNLTEDDTIMRELEAMFDAGDEDNIFDSCENQVQINAIINEIEKFDPPAADAQEFEAVTSLFDEYPSQPSPELDLRFENYTDNIGIQEERRSKTEDLKKSLWPCELHMQNMKLREVLTDIADKNYFKYERICMRFTELFGYTDEEIDYLGPYSPSIDLDEVLVASCRQRIAKWVVQSLMKPLNDGLIGNRYVFKKLAKYLADAIIYVNQYPDQKFIKKYVVNFFCAHPAILSIEDLH